MELEPKRLMKSVGVLLVLGISDEGMERKPSAPLRNEPLLVVVVVKDEPVSCGERPNF